MDTAGTGDRLRRLLHQLQSTDQSDPEQVAAVLRTSLRSGDGWLDSRYLAVDRHQTATYSLYDARGISVVSMVIAPGARPPIHDHTAWSVIGVYRGRVREARFRRLPTTGTVVPEHVLVHDRGAVVVLPAHELHTAEALGDHPAVTIQIYGAPLSTQAGIRVDPESGREGRYTPHYREPAAAGLPQAAWSALARRISRAGETLRPWGGRR
jgi:predicted metal-dependent enzyme (double-stranded beta helix superfamily)